MFWLWVPEGQNRVRMGGLGNRFVDSVYDQITQRDRKLFGGEVTTEDADGASLFESARNLLGNPYELLAKLEKPADPPDTAEEPPDISEDPPDTAEEPPDISEDPPDIPEGPPDTPEETEVAGVPATSQDLSSGEEGV